MSRASMVAASAGVERPPLFGIGSCRVGTEFHDFEIGWDEMQRDTDWATSILEASGLARGDLVLVTLPNWEGPWFSPLISGLRRLGVTYTLAENFSWDAKRAAHLIRSLAPRAVVGLCGETLASLREMDVDAVELLSGIDILWARHDALGTLADLGLAAQPLVPVGPALAIGLAGVGAVVNSAEWTVTSVDGELLVSTSAPRAATFDGLRSGLAGRVGGDVRYGTLVEFDVSGDSSELA